MQDILKAYYASGGKTLFENKLLLEYDREITKSNWGDRIIKAAKINAKTDMGDGWFMQGRDRGDFIYSKSSTKSKPFDQKMYDQQQQKFLNDFLAELEKMDPTENKQYVMWLVKAYTQNIKADAKHQANFEREYPYATVGDWSEAEMDLSNYSSGDPYDDYATAVDYSINEPRGLDSFRLEDINQINRTLVDYHRLKPQLPVEQRDINRFKTFERLEDFVDDIMAGEQLQGAEYDSDTLKMPDVEVIYNGPLGTVAIPRSYEASCDLGSGTKWCTAGSSLDGKVYYDQYMEQGDLIIYNEKPGNQKYQIHVTINGIEARDAQDRLISGDKKREFTDSHPVLSKLIQQKVEQVYLNFADLSYLPNWESIYEIVVHDETRLINNLIDFNEKRGGGVMRFVDEYYVQAKLPDYAKGDMREVAPSKNFMDQLMRYAKQRKQDWPEMKQLVLELLYTATDKLSATGPQTPAGFNVQFKTVNRIVSQLEELGPDPKLEKFKDYMMQKIQQIGTVGEDYVN